MNITVTKKGEDDASWTFDVEVADESGRTAHIVTVEKSYHQKLAKGKVPPAELVQSSFEFLLDREPKETILRKFNLEKISEYFPEYEDVIQKQLET